MRAFIIVAASVASLVLGAGSAFAADDAATCRTRHADLTQKAQSYQGDAMMKKIIQADLDRATRELREGDADECLEALDHADKLLSGRV